VVELAVVALTTQDALLTAVKIPRHPLSPSVFPVLLIVVFLLQLLFHALFPRQIVSLYAHLRLLWLVSRSRHFGLWCSRKLGVFC